METYKFLVTFRNTDSGSMHEIPVVLAIEGEITREYLKVAQEKATGELGKIFLAEEIPFMEHVKTLLDFGE